MDKKILVVIPAYNEASNIVNVIKSIRALHPKLSILIINDCSSDNTRELAGSVKGTIVINLPINMGIGGAVQTGFKYAVNNQFEILIRMDGDGQHDPRYISALIKSQIEGNYDIVIGSRFLEKEGFQSSFFRRIGITIIQIFLKLFLRQNISDSTSGYRSYSKTAIAIFSKTYPDDFPEPEELIFAKKRDLKITEIPVEMKERNSGVSSIKGLSSLYYMIKVLIALIIESVRRKNG